VNRVKVYGIAVMLLITSIGFSFLIFVLRSKCKYVGYLDPVYHLFLFGPTITALVFLAFGKENIAHTVALNRMRNLSGVVMQFLFLLLAVAL
jgi:hypothetical protein